MKQYVISRIAGEPDWSRVPALAIDERRWCGPVDIAAWARLAWSDDAFHVRMTAREAAVRAVETGPLGSPWLDSCLEFFLCPVPGDPRYLNIEFNPAGCLFLGVGTGRADRIRLLPQALSLNAAPLRTPDGWQITYRVPFALIRALFPAFAPRSGDVLRANCFKCGDLTPAPHYLMWNPSAGETADFHRPADFGEMILG